ncbi:hemicentin-1 [Toxorhynchites rutilus septentrionalis]|uniref:hemicentin-1 n=1 Tax=Toxorhynchites rutilus septentrionalis TaxID=329112 RepID=UPI00247AA838|nr:hemicentin-1 [Toxorhynchites rutilus septentrionalis]XP_055618632.1 hemicentin-1 [Toxorhynchites rutilus septentrionalis]
MTSCRERADRQGIVLRKILQGFPTVASNKIRIRERLNRSAIKKFNRKSDGNGSGSGKAINKQILGFSRKAEMVKRTATLLVLVFLVVTFPTSGASYADTEDLINELDRPIPITLVSGVLGKQASLPCDIRPLERDDAVYMVLWFKEEDNEPLYNFDIRGRQIAQARLFSSEKYFGKRAFFRATTHPAQLLVDELKLTDEGIYRCRVDFRNSPTRNVKINFTVVVPPDRPIIYDSRRREKTNTVEPYSEGSDIQLVCEVKGGRPRPNVTWYLDNTVIDESYETRPDGTTVNHLSYPNIGRQHLDARLMCVASNTNLTPPNNKVVVLDVNLKPVAVHILVKEKFVSADKRYDIECKSSGSRPEAMISWWKGARQLKRLSKNFAENGNQSLSVLSLTPTVDDDGKYLTCRAENPLIPDSAIEDKWRLVVHYMPIVTLKMGSSLNPDDIKEGDDIYFDCHIQSNPKPYKLAWYHNGNELHHNVTAGIILSDHSLALQGVSRILAGDYTCMAANTEGRGTSNHVSLRVRYAPVCATDREELLGALKHETLQLKCEVDASPPAESFHWTFNSSGEQTELPARLHSSETGLSRLNYTPTSDLDYGTISCWGRNAIGIQKTPCVFQVVAAGRPFALQNCTISNQSSDSLHIECIEGFDGGLPQLFLLELVEVPALRLVRNLSLQHPPVQFFLDNLEPGTSYRIILFAANAKGRSEPVIVDDITFKGVAKYTGVSNVMNVPLSPVLAALTLTVAILFAVVCIVLATIYRRHASKNSSKKLKSAKSAHFTSTPIDCQIDSSAHHHHHQTHDPNSIQTPLVDGSGTLGRRGSTLSGEPPDGDETDPDVIPNQYERRPPKASLPTPLFRSPSARLIHRNGGEHLLHEEERHCDGSSLASLTGPNNEVHHYSFKPSKQISYATLGRTNNSSSSVQSTLSPLSHQPSSASTTLPLPTMVGGVGGVGGLLSSPASQSLVTSTLNEYRFRPEVVTTSNRIQESCI